MFCLLKRTKPALRAIINSPDFAVNAFICPGHVAAITGSNEFSFLTSEYDLPAVVSGFETADLLYSVYILIEMLASGRHALVNEYKRLVSEKGNISAVKLTNKVFIPSDSLWRGLGDVKCGGYSIANEYSKWDAQKKFYISEITNIEPPGCLCADIIRGAKSPLDCPLFGKACDPSHPTGPCMVSSEGSCAAAWKYS